MRYSVLIKITMGLFLISNTINNIALASVVLLEDKRALSSGSAPPAPFADWANFYQKSQINTEYMSGNGTGYAERSLDKATGEVYQSVLNSHFGVRFLIEEPHYLHLSAQLKGDVANCCDYVSFILNGPTGFDAMAGLLIDAAIDDNDLVSFFGTDQFSKIFISWKDINISETLILSSGEYGLYFSTGSSLPWDRDWTSTSWSFTASFTPVPLPAAFWLFFSSLIFLIPRLDNRVRY